MEDDKLVRDYVLTQLHSLGYVTLDAANATEALAIVQAGHAFDLLFTDVIMPGPVSSTALRELAASVLPRCQVLFTSGYAEGVLAHKGQLAPGVNLLQKPYNAEALSARIRHMLRRGVPA